MVTKLYSLIIGIPPMVRLGPLIAFGFTSLIAGETMIPAIYFASAIVIIINMGKKKNG